MRNYFVLTVHPNHWHERLAQDIANKWKEYAPHFAASVTWTQSLGWYGFSKKRWGIEFRCEADVPSGYMDHLYWFVVGYLARKLEN